MRKIVIAVDGFSSNGKSTMAKSLAKEIGYIYIDSGAMYRAVTLYCIEHNLFNGDSLDEAQLHNEIENIKVEFHLNKETGTPDTYLNGENVEARIRSMEVSSKVSVVSAIPFVRHAMVALQQEMGKAKGIVMDGRDIGTVVFPDAEMKVFVTADAEIRAQRRFDELRSKGDMNTTFEEVLENLKTRDHLDQTRAE
ncbi:MAG: (d)CMP kinase, partial [Prevotella sp.]|nr:(d)CMP kinase [Prevotella sp.]